MKTSLSKTNREAAPEESEQTERAENNDQSIEDIFKASQLKHSKKISVKDETSEEPTNEDKTEQPEDWFQPEGELAIDVYQTDTDIVIQSAIAGVRPEELDVSIENDMVTIRGIRKNPTEDEQKQYFHEECFWGPFSKQIFLPEEGDIKNAEASMKDGIFTLRIPKTEREKTQKLKVAKR